MAKKFELYGILTEIEKLKRIRAAYVDSLGGSVVHKVISSKGNWFFYNKGVYDVEKELKGAFFELSMLPTPTYPQRFVSDFIEYGPTDPNSVKAINYDGKTIFLYTDIGIVKKGRNFVVTPVIPINEDLYNMAKIQFRDFDSVTKDDLSDYSEYFVVEDIPYMITNESRLEDLYRTGEISRAEYRALIEKYTREEILVKSLRA